MGTITTRPNEIDEHAIDALQQLFPFNAKDIDEQVENDFKDYDRFIYKGKEAKLTDISGKDLIKVAKRCTETAAGMDEWAPGDMKLSSDYAFEQLAIMLN